MMQASLKNSGAEKRAQFAARLVGLVALAAAQACGLGDSGPGAALPPACTEPATAEPDTA